MITMYVASTEDNRPSIRKDAWYKMPVSKSPDLEYFATFEEAKSWLQKRTWERVMEAQDQVARMDVDYNAALALKEEDVN